MQAFTKFLLTGLESVDANGSRFFLSLVHRVGHRPIETSIEYPGSETRHTHFEAKGVSGSLNVSKTFQIG